MLKQDDDYGHEKVIAYYGRRLNKHERNYTVTEIELLAALESIRNWRPYLWGRHFKLIIDHAALKWLHTMPTENTKSNGVGTPELRALGSHVMSSCAGAMNW